MRIQEFSRGRDRLKYYLQDVHIEMKRTTKQVFLEGKKLLKKNSKIIYTPEEGKKQLK